MVPNAERVRFMKTGEDANSANVRIARAYTKRDMILMSGYHGYPDWFSTEDSPNNGVPAFMKEYVKIIRGELRRGGRLIKRYGERIACVISIAYDSTRIRAAHTSGSSVRRQGARHPAGSGRSADGISAGKRGRPGVLGVDADLAGYAKAMANGFPLSAYVGRAEYMETLYRSG